MLSVVSTCFHGKTTDRGIPSPHVADKDFCPWEHFATYLRWGIKTPDDSLLYNS